MSAQIPSGPGGFAALSQLRAGTLAAAMPTLAEDADVADALEAASALAGEIIRDQQLVDAVRLFEMGEADRAIGAVADLLEAHPHWVDGYVVMAQLLSQTGSIIAFEHFLIDSIRDAGDDMALAISCLRQLSDAGRHAAVLRLVPELRRRAGDHLFFTLMEAVSATESGDIRHADSLFAQAATQGGLLSLPHVRHLLRKGDASRAATLAEAFVRDQPEHQGAWGLLATAWRMTGDSRHAWLVERPEMVRTFDLDIAPEALDRLAARLRTLHVARHHPFDQSLRGGTQTAGKLFNRDEPEIRMIRETCRGAVQAYIDALPPMDPGHPLLGQDRSQIDFTGSWSVRLVDGGYHVAHFHPQGTLSSAFYVTYPQSPRQGRHAGWLTIGEPPECLNTGLAPLQMIEPKLGRLALFPSFLWHGTRPFPRGERMTIAFDTRLGR